MRFIRSNDTSGEFEPAHFSEYETVSRGIRKNKDYLADGSHGLSVMYDPGVMYEFESDLCMGEGSQGIAELAVYWATDLPHDTNHPQEQI